MACRYVRHSVAIFLAVMVAREAGAIPLNESGTINVGMRAYVTSCSR